MPKTFIYKGQNYILKSTFGGIHKPCGQLRGRVPWISQMTILLKYMKCKKADTKTALLDGFPIEIKINVRYFIHEGGGGQNF